MGTHEQDVTKLISAMDLKTRKRWWMAIDVTGHLFLVVPMKVGDGDWCGCVGFFLFSIFWVIDNLRWWVAGLQGLVAVDDVGHLLLVASMKVVVVGGGGTMMVTGGDDLDFFKKIFLIYFRKINNKG